MAKELKFDTDDLQTAIDNYTTVKTNLIAIKELLNTTLSDLQTEGWDSGAGKAFFDKFDVDWGKALNGHIETLELFLGMINEAKVEFENLSDEADKLDFEG
jgi:hypothetical protein